MKKIFTIIGFVMLGGFSELAAQSSFTYTGKPRFEILTKRNNVVLGAINIELFPTIAPHHVRNFDSLVSTGFYDTTAFHRAVPGFVIQGGDPNSRHGAISTWGYGQPNQPTVNAEFSQAKHLRGSFSAARSNNINSATSQFFICVAPAPNLNGQYSLYGRVTSGMNFADTIVLAPKKLAPYTSMPLTKVEMFVTYLGSNDTIPKPPVLTAPANDSMRVDTSVSISLKWNAVNDAVLYRLQVSRDAGFNDSVAFVTTPNLSYFLQNLRNNTTYYWRVMTNNGGNYSVYSPTWKFYTFDATGISTVQNNNQAVQVFPNPSTGRFTFTNLEKGMTLEIFDVSGRLVSSSTVKDMPLQIDLEGKDKGIYTYRITNLKHDTQQGKLLIK